MNTTDTIVTSDLGNTKSKSRNSRARKWVFTYNNYNDTETQEFNYFLETQCIKYVYGHEVAPSTGTPHLQGYMEFKNPRSFKSIKDRFPKLHFEKALGNHDQNYEYCTKENTGIKCKGFKLGKKQSILEKYEGTVWKDWQNDIINICTSEPDDRSIYWFWEPKGCAGKTTFQKWIYLNYNNVIVLSGKSNDMKNGIIEFKKTNECLPEIILINIPRVNKDFISFEDIESIKDMFFYSGKYEGGMVCGPNPHVLIFSNDKPDISKMSIDRWKIVNI